ncbi:MAG: cytochrome c biogenesis protein CcsA [Pirellulaceae bacterium]|nr:cytochrome c biogenesis protein CcsA [Pirellulaceae bacterium]
MAIDIESTAASEAALSHPNRSHGDRTLPTMRAALRTTVLKLAVALFAASIFLIFVGTVAQTRQDMWEVMSVYFRSWICWINVETFFPETWFPSLRESAMRGLIAIAAIVATGLGTMACLLRRDLGWGWMIAGSTVFLIGAATAVQSLVLGGFLFPGGATIGTLMAVDLLLAQVIMFTVQSRGLRLAVGLMTLAVGSVLTWQIIAAGHNPEGLQAVPMFSWATLWTFCKVGLLLLWLAMVVSFTLMLRDFGQRKIEVILFGGCIVLMAVLTGWVWLGGESAYLGDAGMRILWQLIQAEFVALVLLFGAILTFRKRGGLVLIHAGLGLLMLGEWFVSWYAIEERLMIQEGHSANYAVDIRETELAIVDPTYSETEDDVVVVPGSLIAKAAQSGNVIQDADLPFDIRVVQFLKNSDLEDPKADGQNPATAGNGRKILAIPKRAATGASMDQGVDMASAYVELLRKKSGASLGTYLVSQYLSSQDINEPVPLGDKSYEMALRFRRTYKPYTMHLIDVRKDDYIGTSTPRDYSSYVRLVDTERDVDRGEIRIWMNNPLRYAGETFYQSGYFRDPRTGIEQTTLQVVTNTGWMIPYVACMLVATGMFAHFWNTLLRFLQRQSRVAEPPAPLVVTHPAGDAGHGAGKPEKSRRKKDQQGPLEPRSNWLTAEWIVPAVVALIFAGWAAGKMAPPRTESGEFNLAAFGELPVAFEGRVKPMDTLARNALRKISDYETFRDSGGEKRSAVEWFLDAVARPDQADEHRVFRIYNLEVLQLLGLERRKGFHYSLSEIRGEPGQVRKELAEFDRQSEQARRLDSEQLDFFQRKLLEVDDRFRSYTLIASAFQPLEFPPLPTEEEFERDREAATERIVRIRQLMNAASETDSMLKRMHAPLAVPQMTPTADGGADSENEHWAAYASAMNKAFLRRQILKEPVNPAVERLESIFAAYRRNDKVAFNREVAEYRRLLDAELPAEYASRKLSLESYFNHVSPFYLSLVLYVIGYVVATVGFLGMPRLINRTAFAILVIALLIHTLGLVARIYISGRPPVTNLYSSALFIGWSCVVFGLVLELIFRIGIGNVVAALSGAAALLIAAFLGMRGDTFTVLQAVLDTQFWLATHVVTITLGYAVTFLAGLLGIFYIFLGICTPSLNTETSKLLARMIYGIICFAIFFSFIGTVLGGLWADDSWGRFWGWDPKENGALIIVLWNALILHARWDGLVKERGMAVLAVFGNIVTSWSWFGVNELSVGLHSYGFTEGVLLALSLFVLSQLIIILVGWFVPRQMWMSFRGVDEPYLAQVVR